jgi:trk system potassium uptake protein TrkH
VSSYHVGRRRILRAETARAATTVLLLFILSFLLGTMTALATSDVALTEALFEGVSVGANIGISIGVVEPGMSTALQAVFIVQMILGRLEFVSVLVLIGYLVSFRRGSRPFGAARRRRSRAAADR